MLKNVKVKVVQGDKAVELKVREGSLISDLTSKREVAMNFNYECACEGSLACTTCHVILDEREYKETISETPISDDEMDMLDLAIGLTPTSRLGCQVRITSALEGTTIRLPLNRRNSSPDED